MTKKKTVAAAVKFMAALFILTSAEVAEAGFGTSGWTIFRKFHSTKSKSLTAAVPESNDISGMIYNPSILPHIDSRRFSFISESGPVGDTFSGALYAQPLGGGVLGCAVAYYNAGKAELNWFENGELVTKEVTAQEDVLLSLTYAGALSPGLYGGITLKGAASSLAEMESAQAAAADAGITYFMSDRLRLSAAFLNLGGSTAYIKRPSPLPAAFYSGAGYVIKLNNSYIMGSGGVTYYINDHRPVPELGLEIGNGLLSLNAGYRIGVEEMNLHVGAGISWDRFNFGYSYIPGAYFDASHRVSLSLKL